MNTFKFLANRSGNERSSDMNQIVATEQSAEASLGEDEEELRPLCVVE